MLAVSSVNPGLFFFEQVAVSLDSAKLLQPCLLKGHSDPRRNSHGGMLASASFSVKTTCAWCLRGHLSRFQLRDAMCRLFIVWAIAHVFFTLCLFIAALLERGLQTGGKGVCVCQVH